MEAKSIMQVSSTAAERKGVQSAKKAEHKFGGKEKLLLVKRVAATYAQTHLSAQFWPWFGGLLRALMGCGLWKDKKKNT